MKYDNVTIAWNHGGYPLDKQIKVGPQPDYDGWSLPYSDTDGACIFATQEYTKAQKRAYLHMLFIRLVSVYRIDAIEAYNEMAKIDEFLYGCNEDEKSLRHLERDIPSWMKKHEEA